MTTPTHITGTKGSDVFDSAGSALLDLSVRLVRGADAADLAARVQAVAATSVEDAFVIAFHARNVRGGKGERDIFKEMYMALHTVLPAQAEELLDLVPHYGSWRDIFDLDLNAAPLVAAAQLRKDAAAPAGESISLCAKWAPRESSANKAKAAWFANHLFPEVAPHSAQMKAYRKLVAGLNRRLDTVETHMCGGSWADIKPQSVPGRAGKVYRRALLNLTSSYKPGVGYVPVHGQELRKPDADRMACREHFTVHYAAAAAGAKGVKVHGADTLMPHEIVKKAAYLLNGDSASEKDALIAVWRSLVEKVNGQGGLDRSIMMGDFSGSMQSAGSQGNTPYWVSMALSILGAQCCTGAFKDRFMTFDSTPMWHQLTSGNVFDHLQTILTADLGQGTSTDFQAAMDLVLATLKEQRVLPGQEPENLIVLTDMNWDAACGSADISFYSRNSYRHHVKHEGWETHVEMIRESFKRAGEDLWGAGNGWKMPRIVIWNLAASPSDFHATADTPGVAMLSGWSAAQFKVICEVGPQQLTPLDILRVELDDPQYDLVRRRLAAFAVDL